MGAPFLSIPELARRDKLQHLGSTTKEDHSVSTIGAKSLGLAALTCDGRLGSYLNGQRG